ncbi:MAG: hypothetical protein JNG85_11750 [Spirochaetaceae bacterium]|nr:hypothetical protein [Spirochaetaceae bacterium]
MKTEGLAVLGLACLLGPALFLLVPFAAKAVRLDAKARRGYLLRTALFLAACLAAVLPLLAFRGALALPATGVFIAAALAGGGLSRLAGKAANRGEDDGR